MALTSAKRVRHLRVNDGELLDRLDRYLVKSLISDRSS